MKTNLLTLSIFAISFTGFSQQQLQTSVPMPKAMNEVQIGGETNTIKPTHNNAIQGQAKAGDIIWSDDFSASTNWTIDNAGQAATYGWNIGTTVYTWWNDFSTGISSTSGGGFAHIYNGDYTGSNAGTQAVDVIYNMTTGPLDINALSLTATGTATDNVILQFEQFGALFNDVQEVQVSTDGTNFDVVYTNDGRDAFVGNNPDAIYPNPELISVSLYPFIQGNAGTVYLRFEWTSQFPTSTNLDAWTTFGWFIDDVKILTAPNSDMALGDAWHADVFLDWENSMRPMAQSRELYPGVIVSNLGASAQTVDVTCDISDGTSIVNTTTVTSASLNPGESDTVWFTTGYTPSANGVYEFDFSIPADDEVSNNSATASTLEINDFLMAHDYGANGTYGWDANGANSALANQEHGWGNIFVLDQAATVYGLDVVFGTGTTPNIATIINVWEVTDGNIQGNLSLLTQEIFDVTAANIGNSVVTTIPFAGGVNLNAGMMYIFEVRREASSGESMFIAGSSGSGEDDDFSTVGYGDYSATPGTYTFFNGWGFSPYIRLNFEDQTGIDELEGLNNVVLYPNPANDELNIDFTLDNAADINIAIVDLAGKTVATKSMNNTAKGIQTVGFNTTDFASGVYTVTIKSTNGKLTRKFIKK